MSFEVVPVTLEAHGVRVEPLHADHAQGLFNRGRTAEDWRYLPRPCFVDLPDCRQWIAEALATAGQVPFAIVETARGRPVGSTRFMNIRAPHRGLEIGWTWLGRDWQGTGVNTGAKYLLLRHAFEALGALRVEFKTDLRNRRSQAALERLGATREGVARRHMVVQDDVVRDSVYYSITDRDWPELAARLAARVSGRSAVL